MRRAAPEVAEPPLAGRGGRQHKYLQELIKRLGESRGYRSTVEKQILGGAGQVPAVTLEDSRDETLLEFAAGLVEQDSPLDHLGDQ